MQERSFPVIRLIVFGCMALGFATLAFAGNLPQQNINPPVSLQPSAAMHETRAGMPGMIQFRNPNEIIAPIETVSHAPPTRSSFMATWDSMDGAKGYLLDVSTSNSFSSYVEGYHDLDVGNVNGRAVTGLNPGTTYYYRVRPYTAAGSAPYSNVTTETTMPATGLIIHPTFDCSIINDPNSAVIQAMITQAIGIYESLFRDQITVEILFRYSTGGPTPSPSASASASPTATPSASPTATPSASPTATPSASPSASPSPSVCPGSSPFPPDEGILGQSFFVPYDIPWNDFISALRADATTNIDNIANASLPGSPLAANIATSSANGRALRLNTAHAMFADGTIGPNGPFDGIVTLNSAQPFSFTRPLISGTFDARRVVEHEIDEVMGFGSYLNASTSRFCASQYEAESPDNTIAGGAGVESCPTCSGQEKVVGVGNNSGTLRFNHVHVNVTRSYVVTIWYLNGGGTRYALLSVNGGPGTPVSFPSTGSFQTVGAVQRTITLNAGSNNTLQFSNPITGQWAPDFDQIGINCTFTPPTDLRPQDLFSWSSPGVRNLSTNGSRYFSINGGSTNIVGFNQTPPGDFGDWLSEACPQTHPYVQNAYACPDQSSDISATSPEGINLDVIGYDLITAPTPTPTPTATPTPAVTTNAATNVASFSATLNGSLNPRGATTTVYFQYGPTTSYGSNTAMQTQTGNTVRPISANIAGLNANTTYHFRIVAHNAGGTSFGSDRTLMTLTATGPPVVSTGPATLIASFSATLNGSVDPHGFATTVYFQYGTTTSYGFTTAPQIKSGNSYQNVTAHLSLLNPNTTFHFRIVATNSGGTTHGADRTFTTLSATGAPVVITNRATMIASFSATLNGSVDPHGLSTSVHFEYGTTTSYGTLTGSQIKTGDTYQNISANISGLTANTTYHFRIVATNSAGTMRGRDMSFTTLSATGPAVVTTNPATNVTSSSATLNGSVDPHGLSTIVRFEYGTTTNYGSITSSQTHTGDTYQSVSANLSGLTANTTYHFRIVASNSAGTTRGSDRSFTTPH